MDKARILVVEDNADNLALVRFLLERAGYHVLEADTGLKGLRVARQELPDLILLDMALPELDGWSVAKELKRDPATQGIPLVALTAYTMASDRTRAFNVGCDGFIPKPMDVVAFIEEVGRFIEQKEDS